MNSGQLLKAGHASFTRIRLVLPFILLEVTTNPLGRLDACMRVIAYPLILAFCLIPSFLQAQEQEITIPYLAQIELDAVGEEWAGIPSYYYRFDQSTNMNAQGNFSSNDLDINLQMAWNETGLSFFVAWEDDQVDTRYMGKDSARVQKNGRSLDAMYFYDHLKIQLWPNELNTTFWFAPRTESALQWSVLRKKGVSGLMSEPIPQYQLRYSDQKFFLEAQISWTSLDLDPSQIDDFKLLTLISDADDSGKSLNERVQAMNIRYVTLQANIQLADH